MTIELYYNTSDSNVVNKNIVLDRTIDGVLKQPTSILTPTVTVESEGVILCQYARIPEFNRYYYITDVVSINNKLWSISMSVDVLMTFKNYLLERSAIIARQENLYNLYLDDDKFLVNAQRMYVTKAFPNRVESGNVENSASFIMTLAGGEPSHGGSGGTIPEA